ncbi:hypothetical protein PHJA_000318400 [Phtheirospermum japonicum]|uniref:Uncharacterized protein n=1 Tax=Phtheirospermum japonicum TaxID=374723 RepID=A0A830BI89_9LAMI|nr:hypothetical protein PHJA_000318400 [Phtheirospermum japonicum]
MEYDQAREGCCKEACEIKPPKRVSDYILPHILNLYASRATPQDFEIYAPNATFEDPLMCAHGESRIVDYSIKENIISPGKTEILIDNKQYYKFLGKDIDMISLIRLYTEDGKIVRHEDWWDKKPLWNRETVKVPLVGRITEATRRASMLATHALMRFGKDPSIQWKIVPVGTEGDTDKGPCRRADYHRTHYSLVYDEGHCLRVGLQTSRAAREQLESKLDSSSVKLELEQFELTNESSSSQSLISSRA